MDPMYWEDLQESWDQDHPIDGDPPLEDEELPPAEIPTIDHLPDVVDYSARGPGDYVISGPCGGGKGPGRWFETELQAFRSAVLKYGRQRVSRIAAGEFRWAMLIKAVA